MLTHFSKLTVDLLCVQVTTWILAVSDYHTARSKIMLTCHLVSRKLAHERLAVLFADTSPQPQSSPVSWCSHSSDHQTRAQRPHRLPQSPGPSWPEWPSDGKHPAQG